MRAIIVLLMWAGISAERHEVTAHEAPGLQPVQGEIIIPDARARVPAILKSCGIEDVTTVGATDGVVLFRFVAPGDGPAMQCVKQKLPAGTQLMALP